MAPTVTVVRDVFIACSFGLVSTQSKGRSLHRVHDQHFDGAAPRVQLQTELLSKCREALGVPETSTPTSRARTTLASAGAGHALHASCARRRGQPSSAGRWLPPHSPRCGYRSLPSGQATTAAP